MEEKIFDYIKKYKFIELKNSVEEYDSIDIFNLVNEFWEDPGISLKYLKDKYYIVGSIYTVLKNNISEQYSLFLKMVWSLDFSSKELTELTGIPSKRLKNLIFDIEYRDKTSICPFCYESDSYVIKYNLKYSSFQCECNMCKKNITYFITKKEAEELREKNKSFEETIGIIKQGMDMHDCPNCDNKLYLYTDYLDSSYIIYCSKCDYSSNDLASFMTDVQKSK
ncbi:MAG: hypothetical protein N4A40_12745 [Tissierellales bacterium]|jgi:hypothetical protein|nr:hypothetical protein [Tissierellales bacterium]